MKKEAYFKMMGLQKAAAEGKSSFSLLDWFKRKNTLGPKMNMDHPGNREYIKTINKLPQGKATGANEINVVTSLGNTTKPVKSQRTLGELSSDQAGISAHGLLGGKFGEDFPMIKETLKDVGKVKQALPAQALKALQTSPRADYMSNLLRLIKDPSLKQRLLQGVPGAILKAHPGAGQKEVHGLWQKLLDAYRFQAKRTPVSVNKNTALV